MCAKPKKMAMLAHLSQWLETQTQPHLLCGDFNIAHQSIDEELEAKPKNSGFLPEERAWLDHVKQKGMWMLSSASSSRACTRGGPMRWGTCAQRRLAH